MAAFAGVNFSGIMDPISFFFRSLALAVLPGVGIGLKEMFDILARTDIKMLNYLSYAAEVLVSPVFGYGYQAFKTGWIIGVLFLGVLFLNRIKPRFWCRTLCPLGALLGLCSRFSILGLEKKCRSLYPVQQMHPGLCRRRPTRSGGGMAEERVSDVFQLPQYLSRRCRGF